MKESPTGHAETKPTGSVTCGSPLKPAIQVSRMTRTRNDSSASAPVSMRGAMHGAVGSASTVPGTTRGADPLARPLLFFPRRVGVALRYARRELHSLADAGAEFWLMLFNEWPVNAPDLPCLNDAETFAPRIEAVGSHRVMHC